MVETGVVGLIQQSLCVQGGDEDFLWWVIFETMDHFAVELTNNDLVLLEGVFDLLLPFEVVSCDLIYDEGLANFF
jgi:hypothetical protein